MKPAQLLAQFDRIGEAPEAIPRLRRFILDLAVRGKLIEQVETRENIHDDYMNEPTSEELPANWRMLNFGRFCDIQGGNQPPKSQFVDEPRHGYVRLFQIRDLGKNPVPIYIPEVTTNRFCHIGEILIGRYGASVGKIFWAQDGAYNVALAKFIYPPKAFVPQFAFLILQSNFFQVKLTGATRSAQAGFNKGDLADINFPLPPLAEQHRIVAKVDELMTLCDRLEAAQTERESRRDRLVASSLHRLNNGADPDAFQEHARFYFNHLPRLTTRPDHIKQLRQTILNLAVRGKLVPQDPTDEPASELLKRIQVEQKELIKAGVLKPDADDSRLLEEDLPCDLPATWQWVPLRSIIVFGPQNGISPKLSSRPDAPKAITLTATTSGNFNPQHFKRVEGTIPPDSDFWLRSGDLLFQRGNTREYVGIAAYYMGEPRLFLYPDLMMKVRISQKTSLRYVHICAIAPPARAYFSTHATGAQATMPKINQGTLLQLPIPIPPLTEQHRIVAKVDELMALCDQLETQLTTTQSETRHLLNSILHEALAKQTVKV